MKMTNSRNDSRRVLVIKLAMRVVFPEKSNPFDDTISPLSLLIDSVREIVEQRFRLNLRYGAYLDRELEGLTKIYVYFPSIVIDNNPIYNHLIVEIIKWLNRTPLVRQGCYGMIIWNTQSVLIDTDPQPIDSFPDDFSNECECISGVDLQKAKEMYPTQNNISLTIDRFDLLLEHFKELHNEHPSFFLENIRYISCAFYKQRKDTLYFEREEIEIESDEWLKITRVFGIDDGLALKYYNEVNDYSYTIVSMEELLKRKCKRRKEMINQYNEEKIRHMIKNLFTQKHEPTHNDLWRVFAEFVRRDHFFADKLIYTKNENRCSEKPVNEMRLVINRFVNYLREGMLAIKIEANLSGETVDLSSSEKRLINMIKPFENSGSCKFVELACANYLHTKIKTAIRRTCIPFKDVVVVFDQDKIHMRKALMEDQFTSTASVPIMNFGNNDAEKQAINDVKLTLKRMFAYDDNVWWFIKWMGSLLAHRPERTCLIIHGKKGSNGKTTIAKVLCQILGEYAVQCRPDLLISKGIGGSTCTPFEMELKDKVLAVISEPLRAQIYSSSILKDMTGGDLKTGAKKFQDPETFAQTAKPMILCNTIPTFDESDLALQSRMCILVSPGCFIRGAEPNPEEHVYPADPDFWNELRIRALAFIMVYEGFQRYIKEGLERTPIMMKVLAEWTCANNPYTKFAEQVHQTYNGRKYYTDARDVFSIYVLRNNRANITYSTFKTEFQEATGHKVINFNGTEYYKFYHKDCNGRMEMLD
jgi:hypothetical protein